MNKAITILAALALLALSCGEEEPFAPEGPGRESPNGVLQLIEYAFNRHDDAAAIDWYKAALSPAFIFYFNPQDVGDIVDGYQIPESWTYTEDWTATRNMFHEAYSISMSIPQISAPGSADTEFYAANVTIDLTVMTDSDNGYKTDRGWCDFYFEKEPDGTWRLVTWWDHTSSTKTGMAPTSFGRIKALFR